MRAFFIDEPGKFSFRDIPEPVLKDREVLLRIRKIGYCGSDLNSWRGKNPLVKYPRIPGHEISAEIANIEKSVPEGLFSLGEQVTALPYSNCGKCGACAVNRPNACKNNETLGVQREGAMTEYVALPFEKIVKSDGLDLTQLAIVEPLAIGVHAGSRCEPQENELMLLFGCGMVGMGAAAEAVRCGAKVVAVDIDDKKFDIMKKIGAVRTVNSQKEDLAAVISEMSGGHGARVVLEAIGLPQTFVQAVDLAAYAGRVVFVGYAKEPVTFDTKYFVMKEISIRGSRGATKDDFEKAKKIIKQGLVKTEQVVTREYSFEEAGKALMDWDANPGAVSRLIVEVSK